MLANASYHPSLFPSPRHRVRRKIRPVFPLNCSGMRSPSMANRAPAAILLTPLASLRSLRAVLYTLRPPRRSSNVAVTNPMPLPKGRHAATNCSSQAYSFFFSPLLFFSLIDLWSVRRPSSFPKKTFCQSTHGCPPLLRTYFGHHPFVLNARHFMAESCF